MMDRQINLGTVAAAALWIAAAAALVAILTIDLDHQAGDRLRAVVTFLVAAAATLTVSRLLAAHRDQLRNAFELGRDAGTHERVRKIR